jgi:ABC-type transport system substrate-binding protein
VHRLRSSASVAALAAGVALAVSSGRPDVGFGRRAAEPLVLRVVSTEAVISLDPALAGTHVSLPIVAATCAGLVSIAGKGGVPKPEVAAGLPRVSSDGRTYAFEVRRGFRFSDGRPVSAANFVAAIKRVRDPAMRSELAGLYGREIVSASARGSTLTIHLRRRAGDLLSRLAMPWACPVPVDLPRDPRGVDLVPGSGPYYVASHVSGREVVLARNPYYRGGRPRRPERIVVTIGGTAESNATAVDEGRYDYMLLFSWVAPPPPGQLLEKLAARHQVNRRRFFATPSLGTIFLALNTERPLFRANPRLRRAVNFALDRGEIVGQGGFLRGTPADQLLPPGMPGFADENIYPLRRPDLRRARALAEGHLRAGRAVLYVANEPVALRRADVIRSNLAAIGLTVEIRGFTRAELATRAATRGEPFDLVLTGWHAFYPDPVDIVFRLLDGRHVRARDNFNLSYFDVSAVNRTLDRADRLPLSRRYAAFARLEAEIVGRYAPVAPVFHPFNYVLVSERVGCFSSRAAVGADYGSFCLN